MLANPHSKPTSLLPEYFASILSSRRSFDRTSRGNSGVEAGFSMVSAALSLPSSTDSFCFSPPLLSVFSESSCAETVVAAVEPVVDAADSNLGVTERLLSVLLSSSPIENSNSFGSGPFVCCKVLLLRWRGVLVDGRRAGLFADRPALAASWADRWRACSSAIRASIAPRMRFPNR